MLTKIKHFFCNADPVELAFWVIMIPVLGFIMYHVGFLYAAALIVFLVITLGILIGIGFGLYCLIKWAQSHCEDSDV